MGAGAGRPARGERAEGFGTAGRGRLDAGTAQSAGGRRGPAGRREDAACGWVGTGAGGPAPVMTGCPPSGSAPRVDVNGDESLLAPGSAHPRPSDPATDRGPSMGERSPVTVAGPRRIRTGFLSCRRVGSDECTMP
ncbi:hypothetical protein GCM10027160_46820 [Streptomyces calidiresistens]